MPASSLKAQMAMEYMMIVGLVLLFIIPMWVYVTSVQNQASDELSSSYAKNMVNKIADTAELLYSQGPPAKVTLKIYVPGGIESISISNHSINAKLRTVSGLNDIFATSDAQMNGSLPTSSGSYSVLLEAIDSVVQVSVAS